MLSEKVVILDIDGLRPDALEREMQEGNLPNFRRILGRDFDNTAVVDAVSTAPSTTYPNQASIITGAHPAQHGVSGNDYFDRLAFPVHTRRRPIHRGFDLMHMHSVPDAISIFPRGYANRCISPHAETLYESFARHGKTSVEAYSMYWRGARHVITPSSIDLLRFFAGGNIFGLPRGDYDQRMLVRLEKALGVGAAARADLLFAYFMGNDDVSHQEGPQGQREYLRRYLDPQVGRLVDILDGIRTFDDAMFVLVSDHGHMSTPGDGKRALRFGYPFHRHLHPLFDCLGLEVPGLGRDPFQARTVIGLNGGLAHVYVRSRACDWRTVPSLSSDVLPLADAFFEMNRSGKYLADFKGTLDLVLVKDTSPERRWDAPYRVYVGGGETQALTRYLEAHPELDYADAENRLNRSSCVTSGDIILLSNGREGFYFGRGNVRGTHGGLYSDESRATLTFSLPRGTKRDVSHLRHAVQETVQSRCMREGARQPSVADMAHVIREIVLEENEHTEASLWGNVGMPENVCESAAAP